MLLEEGLHFLLNCAGTSIKIVQKLKTQIPDIFGLIKSICEGQFVKDHQIAILANGLLSNLLRGSQQKIHSLDDHFLAILSSYTILKAHPNSDNLSKILDVIACCKLESLKASHLLARNM